METERQNNQNLKAKEGCIIVPNSFFKEWTEVLDDGPILFYLQLLTYCHKGKDTVWPTLKTLSRNLHRSTKSLTRHHRKLVKAGLIKKVVKGKTTSGNYRRNVYQVVHPDKVKKLSDRGTFVPYLGDKNVPNQGTKVPINNTNEQNQYNNQNCGKELPAVAALDKSKDKREEKMHWVREKLIELDFKESLIIKLLKDYPTEKIEEKLELLLERKSINSPVGWLVAALKNNFQDEEEGNKTDTISAEAEVSLLLPEKSKVILSRKEALHKIRAIKEKIICPN